MYHAWKFVTVYPMLSITWLLMAWRRQEPGHQQPWYSPAYPGFSIARVKWYLYRLCNPGRWLTLVIFRLWSKPLGLVSITLQWRHNEHNGVSNHGCLDCLLNHLFRRRSKKTPKLRVTGLCEGNSPVTGAFPAPRVSNTEMLPFD